MTTLYCQDSILFSFFLYVILSGIFRGVALRFCKNNAARYIVATLLFEVILLMWMPLFLLMTSGVCVK
jgi:hypothetical protein